MAKIWLNLKMSGRSQHFGYDTIEDARKAAFEYMKKNNLEGWLRDGNNKWRHHDGTTLEVGQ